MRTLTDTSAARENKESLRRILFGRSLANSEDAEQRVGAAAGVPIFGLDALGSAAYGPEAAMTMLIPLGAAGIVYVLPLTLSVIVLLGIVYFSYRQTIEAYPNGAGSYTVARENLGERFGLLAGTALMIDYLLNVAVGISTGVGALISAVPSLQSHTLALCLAILVILTFVNLRGVRETGLVFMAPTYIFIACILGAIAAGLIKTVISGGHPMPVAAPPKVPRAITSASAWLLVRAFSSGCTAMTGVEAVSNGVQAFREPVVNNARRTLTIIIAILMLMLAGIGFLVRVYHIGATEPGRPGYESVLSQLVAAVSGRGVFYYLTIGSILAVLSLSANTSFADFPRLCRAMAQDRYLPYGFALRGRRLVYSFGVWALAILSGSLLIVFGGVTDRLIPLFAIGAFLAFTMSQAGMVAHWRKRRGFHARKSLIINATGALATGLTTLVVAVAKFTEGAWITLALLPALILLMLAIHHHYDRVWREISNPVPLDMSNLRPPVVVVPIDSWTKVAQKALRFAMTLSENVQAVYVDSGEKAEDLQQHWETWVAAPARESGRKPPELVIVKSPYRFVVGPIVNYLIRLEREHCDRQVAVVLSELVERHWYHFLLHNQRAQVLTALLMLDGDERVAVINVPWYFERPPHHDTGA
jgi:amino acid transporter